MTDVSVGIRQPCRSPVRWTSNQEVLGFILSSRLCLKKQLSHIFTRLKIHDFLSHCNLQLWSCGLCPGIAMVFAYFLPYISQILDLIYWTILILILMKWE